MKALSLTIQKSWQIISAAKAFCSQTDKQEKWTNTQYRQADRQKDRAKTLCPKCGGINMLFWFTLPNHKILDWHKLKTYLQNF